jgi:polar amino acid transport system substrate-binding protein
MSIRTIVLSLAGTFMLCVALPSHSQDKDLLERIKEKKEIVIATEARYAPFESVENGKIVGSTNRYWRPCSVDSTGSQMQ